RLEKNLDKKEFKKVKEMSNLLDMDGFYFYLKNVLKQKKMVIGKTFKNLDIYLRYLEFYLSVDDMRVYEEQEDLSYRIKQLMVNERKQGTSLLYCDEMIGALNNYLSNRAGSEDVEKWMANKQIFFKELDRISNLLMRTNYFDKNKKLFYKTEKNMTDFYTTADKRNEILADNISKGIKNKEIRVLIAGGYHTQGIKQLLKGKGMSYDIITPFVTKAETREIYNLRIKEQAVWLKKQKRIETAGKAGYVEGTRALMVLSRFYTGELTESIVRDTLQKFYAKFENDTLSLNNAKFLIEHFSNIMSEEGVFKITDLEVTAQGLKYNLYIAAERFRIHKKREKISQKERTKIALEQIIQEPIAEGEPVKNIKTVIEFMEIEKSLIDKLLNTNVKVELKARKDPMGLFNGKTFFEIAVYKFLIDRLESDMLRIKNFADIDKDENLGEKIRNIAEQLFNKREGYDKYDVYSQIETIEAGNLDYVMTNNYTKQTINNYIIKVKKQYKKNWINLLLKQKFNGTLPKQERKVNKKQMNTYLKNTNLKKQDMSQRFSDVLSNPVYLKSIEINQKKLEEKLKEQKELQAPIISKIRSWRTAGYGFMALSILLFPVLPIFMPIGIAYLSIANNIIRGLDYQIREGEIHDTKVSFAIGLLTLTFLVTGIALAIGAGIALALFAGPVFALAGFIVIYIPAVILSGSFLGKRIYKSMIKSALLRKQEKEKKKRAVEERAVEEKAVEEKAPEEPDTEVIEITPEEEEEVVMIPGIQVLGPGDADWGAFFEPKKRELTQDERTEMTELYKKLMPISTELLQEKKGLKILDMFITNMSKSLEQLQEAHNYFTKRIDWDGWSEDYIEKVTRFLEKQSFRFEVYKLLKEVDIVKDYLQPGYVEHEQRPLTVKLGVILDETGKKKHPYLDITAKGGRRCAVFAIGKDIDFKDNSIKLGEKDENKIYSVHNVDTKQTDYIAGNEYPLNIKLADGEKVIYEVEEVSNVVLKLINKENLLKDLDEEKFTNLGFLEGLGTVFIKGKQEEIKNLINEKGLNFEKEDIRVLTRPINTVLEDLSKIIEGKDAEKTDEFTMLAGELMLILTDEDKFGLNITEIQNIWESLIKYYSELSIEEKKGRAVSDLEVIEVIIRPENREHNTWAQFLSASIVVIEQEREEMKDKFQSFINNAEKAFSILEKIYRAKNRQTVLLTSIFPDIAEDINLLKNYYLRKFVEESKKSISQQLILKAQILAIKANRFLNTYNIAGEIDIIKQFMSGDKDTLPNIRIQKLGDRWYINILYIEQEDKSVCIVYNHMDERKFNLTGNFIKLGKETDKKLYSIKNLETKEIVYAPSDKYPLNFILNAGRAVQ
ncbi:hypothetical protein ACFL4O_03495, partial [bacterium]